MDFWTTVWAIVVGLFIFIIILWLIALLVNAYFGNPVGHIVDAAKSGSAATNTNAANAANAFNTAFNANGF